MLNIPVYVVIGIGLDAAGAGNLGTMCPTWPDCDAGAGDRGSPSEYDEIGYVSVKGDRHYAVVGGRVFQEEYAAKGWLDSTDEGARFKSAFLNVLIVRANS